MEDNRDIVRLDAGSTRVLAVAFVSLLALGFIFVIGKGLADVANGSSPPLFGLILLAFGWLAYQSFFNIFWAFAGTEEIEFAAADIKYAQVVYGLKRSKTFSPAYIESAEIKDLSTSFAKFAYSMYGINPYSVRFRYKGKQKMIGAKATLEQAQSIVERLNN